ncbi:MAG: O-methyltransferase [Kiloniellales bacterium]
MLAVGSIYAVSFGCRERRRRKGRPLFDRSPVRLVDPWEIDPVFAITEHGPTRDSEVVLIGAAGARASTSTTEAWILCALAKRARTIFEFGTCTGRTTYLLARNAPADAVIGTITLSPETVDEYRSDQSDPESARWARIARRESVYSEFFYESTEVAAKVEQIVGDSKAFDETPWVGRCDLVFVDGSHAYSYVKSDSEKALRMVRPGGIVVWHDFSPACKGVWRYLNELGRSRKLCHIRDTSLVVTRT